VRILIVAATAHEVAPIVDRLQAVPAAAAAVDSFTHGADDIGVLTTGVGMVATAARCARALALGSYDLAFNFGVCGSFDPAIAPGSVVHVVSDRLAELGAEDGEALLTLDELHLTGESAFANLNPPVNPGLDPLPTVSGITVNTVHGNERSIAAVARRFQPQVESMEGAAFMSSCLVHGVSCAQVGAVSNLVERRNRSSWKMTEAIDNLAAAALRILNHT
jgi:futalosine hydrolase